MKATGSVLGTNTSLPQTSYFLRGDVLDLLNTFLHIALWLLIAGWFYRCGPRVQRFFAATDEETTAPSS